MSQTPPFPVDPVEIARDLVRCPSVTPREAGALRLIETLLAERGFETHFLVFPEEDGGEVANLYARIGTGAPAFAFAGHTDIVPPGEAGAWTHPAFSGEIADGMLWGRGAADMKGGVAASIAAALSYLAEKGVPERGSIAFVITGDEEGPALNGTKRLLAWAAERGERFDHCLLGEPTNPERLGDAVKVGRRGSLSMVLTVEGKAGHVAYPHLADNPVPGLVRLAGALTRLELDQGSERFAPSNLEIVSLDVGNEAFNVIPGSARARINIRFNDLHDAASLERRVRAALDEAAGGRIRYRLDTVRGASESFVTKAGPFMDMVCDAVEAETGRRPELSTSGGTSDARFIKDYAEVVEFGLVGQTMHQVDERVSVEDIRALARIYRRVLDLYFARG